MHISFINQGEIRTLIWIKQLGDGEEHGLLMTVPHYLPGELETADYRQLEESAKAA